MIRTSFVIKYWTVRITAHVFVCLICLKKYGNEQRTGYMLTKPRRIKAKSAKIKKSNKK